MKIAPARKTLPCSFFWGNFPAILDLAKFFIQSALFAVCFLDMKTQCSLIESRSNSFFQASKFWWLAVQRCNFIHQIYISPFALLISRTILSFDFLIVLSLNQCYTSLIFETVFMINYHVKAMEGILLREVVKIV